MIVPTESREFAALHCCKTAVRTTVRAVRGYYVFLKNAVILLAILLFIPTFAFAHDTSVGFLEVTVGATDVRVTVKIAAQDAGILVGMSPLQRPSRSDVVARMSHAYTYIAQRVMITQSQRSCPALGAQMGVIIDDPRQSSWSVLVTTVYRCRRVIDEIELRDELFFDLDDNHRDYAKITAFGSTRQKVFGVYDRTETVHGNPNSSAVLRSYGRLGIEHILSGYDHLAFVFALLLVLADPRARAPNGSRFNTRAVLFVVSGFTLAHSVTLALAALQLIRVSSKLVESSIAVSIGVVALHDLVQGRGTKPIRVRSRPLVAFAFGLVHGLGFAGALGELGLPPRAMIRSLIAFNLGVEVGQLAVAAVIVPVLLLLAVRVVRARKSYSTWVVMPGCTALVALSLYWFFQRAVS